MRVVINWHFMLDQASSSVCFPQNSAATNANNMDIKTKFMFRNVANNSLFMRLRRIPPPQFLCLALLYDGYYSTLETTPYGIVFCHFVLILFNYDFFFEKQCWKLQLGTLYICFK